MGGIQFPLKEQYLKANDTLEGRTAAMKDAPDDAAEVGDRPAGQGGTLFDVVENVEAGDARAGGEMREDPDHDTNVAETPRDGGREFVRDAEQKVTSTDSPRPTIGKLA